MEQTFKDEFEKTANLGKALYTVARGVGGAARGVSRGVKSVAGGTARGIETASRATKHQAQYVGKNVKRGLQGKPMLTKETIKSLDKQKALKEALTARHAKTIKARKVERAMASNKAKAPKPEAAYQSVVPKKKPKLNPAAKKPGFRERFQNMTGTQKALAGGAGALAIGATAGAIRYQNKKPQITGQQQGYQPMRRVQ